MRANVNSNITLGSVVATINQDSSTSINSNNIICNSKQSRTRVAINYSFIASYTTLKIHRFYDFLNLKFKVSYCGSNSLWKYRLPITCCLINNSHLYV